MNDQKPPIEHVQISTSPGIYIVTLTNTLPMKIDLDKRRPDCLQVTLQNCKIGKARNLRARSRCYERIFGCHGTFTPVAAVENIGPVEREILARLDAYRIKHKRRRLEWLNGISPEQVYKTVSDVLQDMQVTYTLF